MTKKVGSASWRYTEIPLPQTIVHYCEQLGIQNIVISAGSRNAPLTNGFVENPFFTTYSVVDERAAAFFGLGMAQQLHKPVALVCTSGSALLNYYPAIAEAYYSRVPLVVISADRMPHRIDIGDGQTIQQEGVFGPHLVGAASLLPDVIHASKTLLESPLQQLVAADVSEEELKHIQQKHQEHNQKEIYKVLISAFSQKGPVHLNVPMEEPLYGMVESSLDFPAINGYNHAFPNDDILSLAKDWKSARKIMILVGVFPPDAKWTPLLDALLDHPAVVLLTEKTSNLKHAKAVASIDCLLAPMELEDKGFEKALQPEVLITFGGMIVSKKIKAFLRSHPAKRHYHIDPLNAYDTFYQLHAHLKNDPYMVMAELSKISTSIASDYQLTVLHQYKHYLKKGQDYLTHIPFSDLNAFDLVFQQLPMGWHLQMANSSPIRYAQLFNLPRATAVFCNRGTSGIDGSTATAIGAAQIRKEPCLLITGDLSFFYDSNGLWNNYIPSSFRIIVINNNGGGIFRILPGEKDSPKYDTYFETIHQRSARWVAKNFGLSYQRVSSSWRLKWALRSFFSPSKRPKILEIQTPRKINDTILLNYFKAMVK